MTGLVEKTKFDVQIETWSKGDVIYQQETVPHWLFEGEREQLAFRRICVSEEGVARQLVAMGWTPPPDFKIGGVPFKSQADSPSD